jgi:predicted nucleic acid-binding protein
VICRRALERKTNPPDLKNTLAQVRAWHAGGEVEFQANHLERLFSVVLEIVEVTNGKLGMNDALLVALQREGTIGAVASFDGGFDNAKGFRRISE